MVFEENDGGVDNANALLRAIRWDVYVNEKQKPIEGGYLLEVVGHDNNNVLWEVINNHAVGEPTDHEEIGLQGFDFNLFNQYEEGIVTEGSS